MKVLLILVDGMRPDNLVDIPYVAELMKKSSYTMQCKTVFPSVTLPCHMSLFHSVNPERHGISTNIYTPQVRPINGLFEQLKASEKSAAFFYNWEELRDVSRPGSLQHSCFYSGKLLSYESTNQWLTDSATVYIEQQNPDFTFLYLAWVDAAGHKYGWMSEEYMHAVRESWRCIAQIMATLPKEYTVIITADHGGHDRMHGHDIPEDMTTPLFLYGPSFEKNRELQNADIKDIAPTIVKLLGAVPAPEWEGTSFI